MLPVHRSPGGNRLVVRAFTTAVPINTVFDSSVGPKYLPCSNRESRWPRRRLDGCIGIHHTRSPKLCQGVNSAPYHVSFVCCLAVSTHRKPTVHAGCIRHKPRAGHLQQTFLAPHRKSKPISPPGVTREWRAHCHIETPLSAIPECPNLLRSSSPPSRNLGSRLGHSILHHQNRTVSTLFHLRFSGTVSGSNEAVIPRYDWDFRASFESLRLSP